MSIVEERNAFFTFLYQSEGPDDYRMWLRGDAVERGQLWELYLHKPPFTIDSIDKRVIPVKVTLDNRKRPLFINTRIGEFKVYVAKEHTGVPLIAKAPAFSAPLLPPHLAEMAREILEPDESIAWWGKPKPGFRANILFFSVLLPIVVVLLFFLYRWLALFGLCVYSTPSQWKLPCYGLAGFGTLLMGVGLAGVVRFIIHRTSYRPLYLVTNRRALVVDHGKKIAEYAGWEIGFARVRSRAGSGDVLFPTQSIAKGDFWAVHDSAGLESALSRIMKLNARPA